MAASYRMSARVWRVVTLATAAAIALCPPTVIAETPHQILWPVAGRPAVVTPGDTFDVGLRAPGALQLTGAGREYALTAEREHMLNGVAQADVTVPENIEPGVYALQLNRSETGFKSEGAVYVVPAIQEEYTFAYLRGMAFTGGDEEGQRAALLHHLLESGASLAFLVGPLLEHASEGEYQKLQQSLAALPLPVLVCPGAGDAASPAYRAVFGNPVYGTAYGEDGFLVLGPGLADSNPASMRALGPAYLARRALRSRRWSTGVTSQYGLNWNLRGQMILFADDPLDYLLAGTVPEILGSSVPFGRARILPPPAIPRGSLLLFDVNDKEIRLRQEVLREE